jgi:hypothetical protein
MNVTYIHTDRYREREGDLLVLTRRERQNLVDKFTNKERQRRREKEFSPAQCIMQCRMQKKYRRESRRGKGF